VQHGTLSIDVPRQEDRCVAALERGRVELRNAVLVRLQIGRRMFKSCSAGDYDAVVLPGRQINPDLMRVELKALKFIKEIFDAKKVVAAVCHAPWLLIETGIAKGRRMTSFKSIKTDVANAGAKWEDSEVVVDQGVITSRNPGDLEAFSAKIIEEVKEGRHTQRSAA
jgi:protease I